MLECEAAVKVILALKSSSVSGDEGACASRFRVISNAEAAPSLECRPGDESYT